MPGPRKLWTGPRGAALRDRAIGLASAEASSLWLVPSPLAREQVARALALRGKGSGRPRVWCWEDAWTSTAFAHPDPPARLSPAGLRAVLAEAIERASRAGELEILARAVEWPGYRRRLLDRFAAWTREERPVGGPPPGESPVDREEWGLFGHQRSTLTQIGAEDPEGWAVWASRELHRNPPPELRRPGQVVAVDPIRPTRAGWRLLDHCRDRARSMLVTLPFDPEPALAELYAGVEPTRRQFLGWGFVEEPELVDGFHFRPAGLDAIETELFRSDAHTRPKLARAEGLKILGGPRGEGLALMVAREVRDRIADGVDPEEILILVPRLDGDAERVREALRSWGLPVAPGGRRRPATSAAVSALRLAMNLPVDGWEVSALVRLLRNGQVRWPTGALAAKFGPSEAASAIRSTRVFRGREALLEALGRTADDDGPKIPHAKSGREAIARLTALVEPIAAPGPWRAQVGRLGQLADGLGLDPDELAGLRDALGDHGWVLGALGPAVAEETLSWPGFAGRVDAILAEAEAPEPDPAPGAIRIEPVGDAQGARGRVVILANLAEGTFPSPDAVEVDGEDDAEAAGRPKLAYSREMLRFAGAAGSADERLVLAFPTTDEKGEKLLPAGFLDDLLRRLAPGARRTCVDIHTRFDPVLADHPELALAPADARVLAVALACRDPESGALRALAASPGHARALAGTADAFEVAHRRREERAFGPYDGRLRDPRAIAGVRQKFGPDHAFSPSQLESFALCPFQFYQRYVLGLKVVDERHELDEDYAGRGDDVHRFLERIHQQMAAEPGTDLIGRLTVLIETNMRVELDRFDGPTADVAGVLREIGARRTERSLGRYLAQFRSYALRTDVEPEPHKFEVIFGQPERSDRYPALTIGEGEAGVGLMGTIDRIDLVRREGKVAFRVIDYKTGTSPAGKDVLAGLASQLPLYALAVERLILPEGDVEFGEVGYWSLPKDGFKAVKLDDWAAYRDRLMTFVLALVAELRGGTFPIDSRKKDCRQSCDFRVTCRVAEVRSTGKVWDGRPMLEDRP